ncbi:MAG: bifunctional oligoribonuclease/PAP phosphatase NrnA [Tenericutes bacterium HGW-Tenericutes-3]|nr:MAG: bifunctional oligoribonuclease/PAP phosphatase NrnA [Tenericutes bacterium HGW-Tenericutes-3]
MKGPKKMQKILNRIKKYETIIIHGHKRPDGDCYGAQFGLKNIIQQSFPDKKVYVVGQTSAFVDFVGKMDDITDDTYDGALSIVVDTAVEDRISDERYKLGKEIIKIDHHIPVDDYGDIRWVDTNFPSCAQMIAYFYFKYKKELKMSLEGAIAMYTGIVTDTGRFRFRGVSNLTHQMAGMLIDKGVDVEYIDGMLGKESLEMIALKGYVYSNFVTADGFIYLKMTRDVIEKFNVSDEQAASVVGSLGGIEGFPVWALFIEYPGEVRIRLRSNGPTINELANRYGGGGHAKASGCRLESWDDLPQFVKDAEAVVKAYKEA